MTNSIFSKDCPFEKALTVIDGVEITQPAGIISYSSCTEAVLHKGEQFSREIAERHFSDFEKEGDRMVHVSTFALIDGFVYMTYYANTHTGEEDSKHQTARLSYCPIECPDQKVFLDIQSVGDTCSGLPVNRVYDTIFAKADDHTLMILWTAQVGDNYYRLFRRFDLVTKTLGEIGVNRLQIGNTVNDFSTTGIQAALAENGIGCKKMYSDIGMMQKFTTREENGVTYYYTGAYSGDLNMIIKSRDFITWEYVSQPAFPNLSKWENATYVLGDKIYYFVRQQDTTPYGFLTVYHIDTDEWETPALVDDCQSRSDFILHEGELYLFHAPIDREHIGVIRINQTNIAGSTPILLADMHGSCFYPFIERLGDSFAMSYTVERRHIRLARFDLSAYTN
ncbi:MAG: hypothetical protein IJW49_03265 [Clostridia bacterium]|nr:hypothetical protein [Clostridia bacterium]